MLLMPATTVVLFLPSNTVTSAPGLAGFGSGRPLANRKAAKLDRKNTLRGLKKDSLFLCFAMEKSANANNSHNSEICSGFLDRITTSFTAGLHSSCHLLSVILMEVFVADIRLIQKP